jgi:hypothetical protein
MVKKALLAGVAALFLATGTAHAEPESKCNGEMPCDSTCAMAAIPGKDLNVHVKLRGKIRGKVRYGTFLRPLKVSDDWVLVEEAEEDPERDIIYGWVPRKYIIPVECPKPQRVQD